MAAVLDVTTEREMHRLRAKVERQDLELSHLREQVAQQDDQLGDETELALQLEEAKMKAAEQANEIAKMVVEHQNMVANVEMMGITAPADLVMAQEVHSAVEQYSEHLAVRVNTGNIGHLLEGLQQLK